MDVGIVGPPLAGKTSLFSALSGSKVEGYSERAHVGVANIPDPRLGVIATYIVPKKIIPATLQLVDIPGVPPGSDAKKLNGFLEQVRQVDAIIVAVRCFDDGSGRIDPVGDTEQMETELILADLVVVEGAVAKATRIARSGDADAKARLAVLAKVQAELEHERPARALEGLNDAERVILRGYGLITGKPVLYVANIEEASVGGASTHADALAEYAVTAGGGACVAVCAKLEAELAELDDADRDEMLESLGLAEPALGPLARAAHAALGLTTFYTASEKEVRAWTTPLGATAPKAAGVIHTDIERGFIRAECYHVDDLVEYKTEKAIRDAGKLRSEGKGYCLADGDVVHFLFNV